QSDARVELGFELDDHLGRGARTYAAGAPDGGDVLAHDGALQHLEAGRAEDVETDLRSDTIHSDQHLEQLQLWGGREPIQRQLILTHVRVDVQLEVTFGRGHLLTGRRRQADHVADASDVQHHEIGTGPANRSAQVSDHRTCTADENLRLRRWHIAIATASRACSSILPSGILTCAAIMRAIWLLSALP